MESVNTRQHILLVDDDRQVVRYLTTALEEAGFEVTGTTSGKKALACIRKRMPDLMILDLNMPKPDGLEILTAERSRFPYLRILVISGYLDGALLGAAKLLGAIATLEKPLAPDVLVAKVHEVLGK